MVWDGFFHVSSYIVAVIIIILCGVFLPVCLYTLCLPDPHRGQKRVLYSLEPELQVIGSLLWVLGTEPGASAKVSRASVLIL